MTRFQAALCVGMLILSGAAVAFPDKPIRLIVPFPAGGATDVMARGMAQRLGSELGQQIIVDNRGGAGGTTAAEAAAKSAADTLHAALGRTMGHPALRKQLAALGIEPAFGTPEELAALTRAELPKWAEIVKRSGATAE